MELRHLGTFLAVAELRHFGRAADRCNLSQPAVSHQIRQLEEDLGARLLNRDGRRVTLTVAGELLLEDSRRILAAVDRARERVQGASSGIRGRVRVGATDTPGLHVLPDLLRRYHQTHPQFDLHFEVDGLETILARVAANELDMAVVAGHHTVGELQSAPIGEDPLVVIAPPDCDLMKRRGLSPADLAGESWILREPGSDTRRQFDVWSRKHRLAAQRSMTFKGCEAVKRAVGAGLGVSLISRTSVEEELRAGRVSQLRLRGALPSRPLLLVDHPHKHHGVACRALIDLLHGAFARGRSPVRRRD